MCIDLCSSCFYTSKPFAKPSHKVQPDILAGQPVIALELAAPKALPLTSSCAVITTEVHVPDVEKAAVLVVNINVTSYATLFVMSSHSAIAFCSALSLISSQTLSVPYSQPVIRAIRTHHMSNAKLIAQVIARALESGVHVKALINMWCKKIDIESYKIWDRKLQQMVWLWDAKKWYHGPIPIIKSNRNIRPPYPSSAHQVLKIQIDASDRRQQYASNIQHTSSPTLISKTVKDYAFLASVSRLGSIGIKVLIISL